jgi:hypothetical protein
MIADITTLPPPLTYPATRALLEGYAHTVSDRLSISSDTTRHPLTEGFVWTLRAEATDDNAAVEAAQPLVTVAANLAELEMASIPRSDGAAATTRPVVS